MATQVTNFGGNTNTLTVVVDLISQDAANNRSTIRYRAWISAIGYGSAYNSDGSTNINGDVVNRILGQYSVNDTVVILDGYYYIYHDANGNANPQFGCFWQLQYSNSSNYFYYALPQIIGAPAPTVGTVITESGIANLTTTSVDLYGTTTSRGGTAITYYGFAVSTSPNPTVGTVNTHLDYLGYYYQNVSGLTPGTLYHYRAFVENAVGDAYGVDRTFTTYGAPTVTSSAATSIAQTTATGNGNVTSGYGVTSRGICWSTSANPVKTGSHIDKSGTTGAFTGAITGLSAGTTYHFRPWATNSVGTVYGADRSFLTLELPSVTSSAATNVFQTSATLNGNMTDNGNPNITSHGFALSNSVNPTIADGFIHLGGVTTGAYSSALTGLPNNTTYHYRAYATNSQGTVYGADESFTTDISYFTNPTNAYASDNSYATAASDSGVIAVRISKDGGTTWSAPKTKTYTSTEGYQTYGSATDKWGLVMTGANINSATLFLVKITSGTTNLHSQIYKGFGYAETASATVMGLQVQIEAKYASSVVSVDHIRVIPTMSVADADIVEGSTAYDSTLNTLTSFNGTDWDSLVKGNSGAWKSWTPTLGHLSGGTLNYAVYTQIGKTVHFYFAYTLGGAGIDGAVTFTLPVTAAAVLDSNYILGHSQYSCAGVASLGFSYQVTTDAGGLRVYKTDGTYLTHVALSATVPGTWAVNNTIQVVGTYQVA